MNVYQFQDNISKESGQSSLGIQIVQVLNGINGSSFQIQRRFKPSS